MKLVEMKCKNCGSLLKVDPNEKDVECQYCHASYKLDDEVQHIEYNNMEQSGYEFEKGRIRAQKEENSNHTTNSTTTKKKNNKTLWLVLAWIFLLPFTATYFIVKSNKLTKKQKIIILVILWLFFFLVPTRTQEPSENKEQEETEEVEENKYAKDDVINEFITNFKEKSTMELTNIKKGNIRTKYFVFIDGQYTELLDSNDKLYITINGDNKDDSIEKVSKVYKEVIKVLDSNLNEEIIDESIEKNILTSSTISNFSLSEKISVEVYPSTEVSYGKTSCRIEINYSL